MFKCFSRIAIAFMMAVTWTLPSQAAHTVDDLIELALSLPPEEEIKTGGRPLLAEMSPDQYEELMKRLSPRQRIILQQNMLALAKEAERRPVTVAEVQMASQAGVQVASVQHVIVGSLIAAGSFLVTLYILCKDPENRPRNCPSFFR